MAASDLPVQVHRLGLGRFVAVLWFIGAGLALFDIIRRGALGDYAGPALALVASGLVAYAFGVRPAVIEELERVTVRNPLRTVHLPWAAVTGADVTDVLRLHAGELVVRCFAVPFSRPTRPSRIAGGAGALTGLSPLPSRDAEPTDSAGPLVGRAGTLADRLMDLAGEYGRAGEGEAGAVREEWAPDGAGLVALAVVLLLIALAL